MFEDLRRGVLRPRTEQQQTKDEERARSFASTSGDGTKFTAETHHWRLVAAEAAQTIVAWLLTGLGKITGLAKQRVAAEATTPLVVSAMIAVSEAIKAVGAQLQFERKLANAG